MKINWKPISIILSVLLAVVLVVGVFLYFSTPRLSVSEKRKIEAVYYSSLVSLEDDYKNMPLIWYDENGYVEENHVWRYLGKYGDCYAFLQIGDNIRDGLKDEVKLPYPIEGLSKSVSYHVEAAVVLYHTEREFTYGEVHSVRKEYPLLCLVPLAEIGNREEWLTDAQLEQLTRDIEKLANKHN